MRKELRHRSQRGKRIERRGPAWPRHFPEDTCPVRKKASGQGLQETGTRTRGTSPGARLRRAGPRHLTGAAGHPPQAVCARHGRGRSSQGTASLHGKTARPPGLARGGAGAARSAAEEKKAHRPLQRGWGAKPFARTARLRLPTGELHGRERQSVPLHVKLRNGGERNGGGRKPFKPAPQSAWWPPSSPDREACGPRRLTSVSREWLPCGART